VSPSPSGEGARAILLISCPDQPGLVASVAGFVFEHHGNIVHAEQHTDREEGVFFQRVEFELDGFGLGRTEIADAFARVAERFGMSWRLRFSDDVTRVGILVSHQTHCLDDLLARWKAGELPNADMRLVIGNHPDAADTVAFFGARFEHLPTTPVTRGEQEAKVMALLDEEGIDLLVLARYMQILGPDVVERYRDRVINIHHSFLPAFLGARPYHRAHERGVKLIGATAHYATEDLDEGPIIEQEVMRVSHRDSVDDLVRKGRDLERLVLARAVRAHLEHRVLTFGRKTVVFD
jgi:formyltetrahydrofolate deformylase